MEKTRSSRLARTLGALTFTATALVGCASSKYTTTQPTPTTLRTNVETIGQGRDTYKLREGALDELMARDRDDKLKPYFVVQRNMDYALNSEGNLIHEDLALDSMLIPGDHTRIVRGEDKIMVHPKDVKYGLVQVYFAGGQMRINTGSEPIRSTGALEGIELEPFEYGDEITADARTRQFPEVNGQIKTITFREGTFGLFRVKDTFKNLFGPNVFLTRECEGLQIDDFTTGQPGKRFAGGDAVWYAPVLVIEEKRPELVIPKAQIPLERTWLSVPKAADIQALDIEGFIKLEDP